MRVSVNILLLRKLELGKREMAVDLRQVMAAFLTFSMFIMLGNMIKKDHIDPLLEPYPESTKVAYDSLKVSKAGMLKLTEISDGVWRENNEAMKPCWNNNPSSSSTLKQQSNNAYILFTLSHAPEFHASQVANAVAVAHHLGATLAIPDIRGTKLGEKRHFEEIYDVDTFIRSLNGVVEVDKNPPPELSNARLPVVRVPHRVSNDFLTSKVDPIFQTKRNLKIVTYFNNTSRDDKHEKSSNTYECMAMFESLKLQSELQEVFDSMVGTLRGMSQKTLGRFVAVDLRVDVLKTKSCTETTNSTRKRCYNAQEMGEFLRNIGFQTETTVYLTQTGWSNTLDPFRDLFPNTFTKDAIIAADQKAKLMDRENKLYEKMIDLYMCKEGDVFVAAYNSRFYSSIVGKRIGEGKTQIYVPATPNNASSATPPYIANRTHFAYSCFC